MVSRISEQQLQVCSPLEVRVERFRQTGDLQFGFDAEHKYQVEIVATPNQEPEPPTLSFEFFYETDCLWSGQVSHGFIFSADWGNQCGAAAVEHSGNGIHFFEYKLCDSENECVRKDEVMIFEDDGETLIFSR